MRTLAPSTQALLSSGHVAAVVLIEMALSPVLRLCTAATDLSWGGFTWIGAGQVGQIEPIIDQAGDSEGLRLTLSNVPPDMLAMALGQSVRGKRCTLRMAIINPANGAIDSVHNLASLDLDQMGISEGPQSGSVNVSARTLERVFRRPKPLRYTDSDQQRVSPGDRSLTYLVSQAQHRDVWPAASFFRK